MRQLIKSLRVLLGETFNELINHERKTEIDLITNLQLTNSWKVFRVN